MERNEAQKARDNEYGRLGGAALRGAGIEFSELGVNDYATHLDQYLRQGEAALAFIEEDLITDSGEKMVRAKYINQVKFRLQGNDFLSEKGNFSMRKMAANTQDRMAANEAGSELQQRAEIEAGEPDKLLDWFAGASTREVFDVDSLPLAKNEKYAVKRRYSKLADGSLSMHVIILHSPSIAVFNEYHQNIGADVPPSIDALGALENSYALKIPEGMTIDEFNRADVDAYDEVLAKHSPGQEFVFGIPADKREEIPNSNDVIRRQKPLLNIYKEAIRALGQSDWQATPEVIGIDSRLGLGLNFSEGQALNLDHSRALLDGVHQYIMSTLNNAPDETLDMLAALHEHDSGAAYGVAGHYGGQARQAGIRYESSACPTVNSSAATSEQAIAETAFRLNKDPTKCVMCPGCSKVVDLDPKLYKEKILHCVECKLTVKDGKVVDHREVFGKGKRKTITGFDIITNSAKRSGAEVRLKRLLQRQQTSGNEWEKRRLQKIIEREAVELEELKHAA